MKPIVVEGVVEPGRQIGRELGFPTANLSAETIDAVADGVYRSRTEVEGVWYESMSNLGRNPSVGGDVRRLETHLFDFSGSLYGCRIRVELLEKIRDERRFSTIEELREQLEKDRLTIQKLR